MERLLVGYLNIQWHIILIEFRENLKNIGLDYENFACQYILVHVLVRRVRRIKGAAPILPYLNISCIHHSEDNFGNAFDHTVANIDTY